MEYAPEHGFTDCPTLFAINRDARFESTKIVYRDKMVIIDTGKLRLVYRPDGQPFNAQNLTVSFNHNGKKVIWTPGMTNKENLRGPVATLDGVAGPIPLPDGLLSRDGWYVIDDTGKPVLKDGWIAPRQSSTDIDWYFFAYGSDYKSAMKSLAQISGKVPMPRRHVLGSWYCRWYPYTADEFKEIVEGYREHDFPLDIMVMDMDWHTRDAKVGYGHAGRIWWTGYTWNRELIPDPVKLLKEFAEDGIYVTLNDHPADGMRDHEEYYDKFMSMLEPGTSDNPPFNAGDKRYMEAFFETALRPREEEGVDFWWLDWQQDYIYPHVPGIPGLLHLPWLNYLYYNHSQRDGLRGQSFSRWGGWGDHRHPIQFSGDDGTNWEMLAFLVPFTLVSGNTGCFFWAHDTGGFIGERNPETYARWVQFSALSASLRLHSYGDNLDRRPWLWGQPFEDSMRASFHLRSQIFPYIYTSVRQCYDDTLPLLRPMYFDYPNEEAAYKFDSQYFLGDNLLCAPIVTPGEGDNYLAKKEVWFPEGEWFNFFTGEKIVGGKVVTVSADIMQILLYAKAGVPIPMQPYTPRMTTTPISTLIVRCYPGEKGDSVLYEDDGRTQGYTKGDCAWTGLHYERDGNTVKVKIDPVKGRYDGQLKERSYQIELPATKKAVSAKFNSKPIEVEYDSERSMNIIRVPKQKIDRAVEVIVTF